MNLLLDTHAFLWFIEDNPRLSQTARALIESETSQPFLSVASLWEIAIKTSLGKLSLAQPYAAFIPQQLAVNGVGILNITLEHTAAIAELPFHHRDPFDRMLAVQATTEKMILVSADPVFRLRSETGLVKQPSKIKTFVL